MQQIQQINKICNHSKRFRKHMRVCILKLVRSVWLCVREREIERAKEIEMDARALQSVTPKVKKDLCLFFMIIYLFLVCHSFKGIICCKIYFRRLEFHENVCISLLFNSNGFHSHTVVVCCAFIVLWIFPNFPIIFPFSFQFQLLGDIYLLRRLTISSNSKFKFPR